LVGVSQRSGHATRSQPGRSGLAVSDYSLRAEGSGLASRFVQQDRAQARLSLRLLDRRHGDFSTSGNGNGQSIRFQGFHFARINHFARIKNGCRSAPGHAPCCASANRPLISIHSKGNNCQGNVKLNLAFSLSLRLCHARDGKGGIQVLGKGVPSSLLFKGFAAGRFVPSSGASVKPQICDHAESTCPVANRTGEKPRLSI
jgi:hypothetical protein